MSDGSPESPPNIEVVDNADLHRYEIYLDGRRAGFAAYRVRPGVVVFTHTEIDPEFADHGLGSRLAVAALDDVRARGLLVEPQCPFLASYIERHPAYQDLVVRPSF